MVTDNMVRMCEGKWVFSDEKYQIYDCSLPNKMPETDQLTDMIYTHYCTIFGWKASKLAYGFIEVIVSGLVDLQ